MIKRIALALTMAALIAGCSSGVKLDEVPVEDKTAIPTQTGADGGANAGSTTPGGVAGVDLDQSARAAAAAGPVGVARIVYFDYDSYVIRPEFQPLIEAHSRYLQAAGNRKLMLEGHTDERGGREYNLALGQKRAEAVRRALGLLGVPERQVEAVSFGKEKPAVQGSTEDVHAQNRRVELSYR
ncbi:peptidoglycan-associated lipoprotein Pal [Verminephrobacter aporrectodeae]|uniref:Peptidoglycan-associated lipoprotein n=1 Tax=Verminephrobacter aporrectodeae subsp. tuberculatae TaxID=1110392 RepID=A0ABT3KVR4_9BURK|nr:peptidoglycan-associated lipoprotein Pal [Verminephrobacter aporrectodeae]MCW5222113.1 peptidoglycan-associated lipoprotein Pal [Verminephrobacter aporrectodeae subsp. tuberculatae]MCW5258439.1 peptidoglycan-associated lipoprotein Pal [Verminephrobacter aporrectodeae subsp. tuberculatae]MCW5291404.1 peptidoglycan-associated lipoprotein Pal [Verminephrobacter aporrectodeae subsp. tuberculatae]MCW5322425.1 peptidoglycan-associated lipoprotein Pal [Verminephrobacter aporrectodeae subsp. tubercu